jgi:hypothetical protein
MSKEFENYRALATGFCRPADDPLAAWQQVYDWYRGAGRQQFLDAFTKETGIKINGSSAPDDSVAAAIPRSYRDLETKAQNDAFYRAHAAWYLEEMDQIVSRVPRDVKDVETASLGDVLRFVRPVLLDSVLLFEDWGTHRLGVPGVFGIGKNPVEHIMAFYQGARQTIYGHGSWGLSFADNHADLATATIRQAIEVRLRRAFGVFGKVRKSDDSIHPVPLSDLLDAIDVHKATVTFPVRFENIKRINGWTNMYLHAALKLYAWCPPRALAFTREFLLGQQAQGSSHNSKAGVILDMATFDKIRDAIRTKHESADFELQLPSADVCEVVIR